MKASDLRPGQFFDTYRNHEWQRCQFLHVHNDNFGFSQVYLAKDMNERLGFVIDACTPDTIVNHNVPQCWPTEGNEDD